MTTTSIASDLTFPVITTSNTIAESIRLIRELASVIKECPHCVAKLKISHLNKNYAGVTSSSLQNIVDTTTQTRKLYHHEYLRRQR